MFACSHVRARCGVGDRINIAVSMSGIEHQRQSIIFELQSIAYTLYSTSLVFVLPAAVAISAAVAALWIKAFIDRSCEASCSAIAVSASNAAEANAMDTSSSKLCSAARARSMLPGVRENSGVLAFPGMYAR